MKAGGGMEQEDHIEAVETEVEVVTHKKVVGGVHTVAPVVLLAVERWLAVSGLPQESAAEMRKQGLGCLKHQESLIGPVLLAALLRTVQAGDRCALCLIALP